MTYIREKTRVDTIYEIVRDRICVGHYPKDHVFHETALGNEFELSRTPIRQVLQRLAFEKLAVVRTGVGTIVEDSSGEVVVDYIEIHARLLDSIADRSLAKETTDLEERLAPLLLRSSRLSDDTDKESFWQLLKGLHLLANSMIGDDLLQHMDSLLFYRCGPSLVRGAIENKGKAIEILKQGIDRFVTPPHGGGSGHYFRRHATTTRDYAAFLG